MTEAQYKIVKFFLEDLKTPPKILVKKWNAYWQKTGSETRIDLIEVCRVQLTVNYQVYKNDTTPGEDVMLALFGA